MSFSNWKCIASMRFFFFEKIHVKIIVLHRCDLTITCFRLKSSCFLLTKIFFYVLQWKQNDRNRCFCVVIRLFECNIFISHESFYKLRKFFRSFWRFWFMIIVFINWKLKTMNVCRWNHQRNRMIEITCVDFLLHQNNLFWNFFLKFCLITF